MATTSELTGLLNRKIRDRYSKRDVIEAMLLAAEGVSDSGTFVPSTGGTFTGSVTVNGDLIVNGTQFITNTETVEIEDNLLLINKGELGTGVTAGISGIQVDRGLAVDYQFMFVESDDTFKIGEIGNLQSVATRQDSPVNGYYGRWNDSANRIDFVDQSNITAGNSIQLNGVDAVNYVLDSELTTALSAYVTSATLTAILADYATEAWVNLQGFLTTADLTAEIDKPYVEALGISAASLTGTLADARLSGNVPLKDALSNIFTGEIQATSYLIGGNPVINSTGTYNVFRDPQGAAKFYIGGTVDQSNYYDNTNHYFRSELGSLHTTINSSGITTLGGNSTQWNGAYSWGNHALAGYLTVADLTSEIDKPYVDALGIDAGSLTGTLAEPRLPFRMNQNVRTTDEVTFGGLVSNGTNFLNGRTGVGVDAAIIHPTIQLGSNSNIGIQGTSPFLFFSTDLTTNDTPAYLQFTSSNEVVTYFATGGHLFSQLVTVNAGLNVTGTVIATSFSGNGSSISNVTAINSDQLGGVDAVNYVLDSELTSALSSYVTSASLTTTLSDYVLTTTLSTYLQEPDIAGIVDKSYVEGLAISAAALTGTLAESRLPFRMNQNVRSTDAVTFASATINGTITATSTIQGTAFLIGGNPVINSTGTYNIFRDPQGVARLYLGGTGDPNSYYDNTNHYFRNELGSVHTTINSTAIYTTGGNSLNWNAAYSWGNHTLAGYLTLAQLTAEIDKPYVDALNVNADTLDDYHASIGNTGSTAVVRDGSGYIFTSWHNLANNTGLYSDDGSYLYMTSSGWAIRNKASITGYTYLSFQQGGSGTDWGGVYAAGTDIGFVSANAAAWKLRVDSSGTIHANNYVGQINGVDSVNLARTDITETFVSGLAVQGGDLAVTGADITTNAWIKTGAPTGGTAKKFKIGALKLTDTVELDTEKWVELELETGGFVRLGVVAIVPPI